MPATASKLGWWAAAVLAAAAAAPSLGQAREVQIQTRWVFETNGTAAGTLSRGVLEVTIPERWHVQSNTPSAEFLVPTVLTVTTPPGVTVREIVYPRPVMIEAELISDVPLSVFEHQFRIGVALDVGADVAPGSHPLRLSLRYQACDDKICLMPTAVEIDQELSVVPASATVTRTGGALIDAIAWTGQAGTGVAPPPAMSPVVTAPDPDCDVLSALGGFELLGATGGYMGADDFIAFIEGAEKGTLPRSAFEGKGPLAILLLVIVGGVLLNLTPCVLPLIPINLAIIGAGAQAGSRLRGFALGGAYGLAMAVVYGVLGLLVTLTAATFGAINSTVWFNAGIAVLFVVLSLAMFDIVHIDFSRFGGSLDLPGKARRGTFILAFGMGGVAALLAGACVAPVVIQVIVYAGDQYARGETSALALPFFLGVGMALPWPLAGAGLAVLPRPGKWMVRVKQAMGIFILAFAAYYGYTAWQIIDSRRVEEGAVFAAVEEQLRKEGWTGSICEGLATARAENKPVLIDMWATWCKNCLVMDKTTFKDEKVLARLDGYVKIKFQAEELNRTPAREMIERFEQIGLPAYAVLRPSAGG